MKTKIVHICALSLMSITALSFCDQIEQPTTSAKTNEEKKNLIELTRQSYSQILSYDPEENKKDADIIKEYKKLVEQSLDSLSEAVNALTDKHVTEVNNLLKNKAMNPSPEFQEYFTKCGVAGMKLGEQLQGGKTITKEMIKEQFSFVSEFTKGEIDKPNTELIEYVISLLEKQENSKRLVKRIKKNSDTCIAFAKKHSEEILNFLFEAMIHELYNDFSSAEALAEKNKDNNEWGNKLCDEIGMSNEERNQIGQKTIDEIIACKQSQEKMDSTAIDETETAGCISSEQC